MKMFNTNENKTRESLLNTLAVTEYLSTGHKVVYCKPQRNPKSRKVTVKSKLVFGTAEPKNRPTNAWDVLLTA